MVGVDELISGVQQEKGAGSVSAFGVASGESHLSNQGGLLISGHSRDRQAVRKKRQAARDAKVARARQDFGEHGQRNAKIATQLAIPAGRLQIEQESATRIGHVRGERLAAGQSPDEKAVDGAAGQATGFGAASPRRVLIQKPAHFAGREIGIKNQPGSLENPRLVALMLAAKVGGATILPDHGAGDRTAGGSIPENTSFSLIGQPDGGQVADFD